MTKCNTHHQQCLLVNEHPYDKEKKSLLLEDILSFILLIAGALRSLVWDSHRLAKTGMLGPLLLKSSNTPIMSSAASAASTTFQNAHRRHVQSLYKRSLKLALDWYIQRDLWRQKALDIRAQFERNKHVTSPKELQALLKETEKQLQEWAHPDPYRRMCSPSALSCFT